MRDRLVGVVTFNRADGSVNQEVWEGDEEAQEELVKMGDMDNFHSLLGRVQANTGTTGHNMRTS